MSQSAAVLHAWQLGPWASGDGPSMAVCATHPHVQQFSHWTCGMSHRSAWPACVTRTCSSLVGYECMLEPMLRGRVPLSQGGAVHQLWAACCSCQQYWCQGLSSVALMQLQLVGGTRAAVPELWCRGVQAVSIRAPAPCAQHLQLLGSRSVSVYASRCHLRTPRLSQLWVPVCTSGSRVSTSLTAALQSGVSADVHACLLA